MITIENVNNKIYLFGRSNKTSTVQEVDFTPYFYVEDVKGEFVSIDGKKLKKIVVSDLSNFYNIREKYKDIHYEADIRYVNRYIIDCMNEIKKEEIRICYLDIEIKKTERGYESCEKAINPITCIGWCDSFTKEYKQLSLKTTHINEREMLKDFVKSVIEADYDMFIAWNGEGFDFPFIINRLGKLGINKCYLSRMRKRCSVHKVAYNKYHVSIFGRICFDLLEAYKKMNPGGRESWSLDYISKYEKVGEKEKYVGELDDLYENDIVKFLQYNKKDVELLVLLNEKLKIVEYFDELRRLCFCRFEDIFMNTKMADCLCLKYAKEHNFILPSCNTRTNEKSITGAFVKENIPKLYDNVALMDMKSLYPSIMIGFNTSYETLLDKQEEGCINMFGQYFYKKEDGIIPAIVKPLLRKRKEVNKLREKIREEKGDNDDESKALYITQYALKQVANSFYGVLLEPHFRLGKRDVGQSITFCAQQIIREVHRWFEEKGMIVVYGDTDSAFICMEEKSINDMIILNKEINNYFTEFFLQFNINENIFKLEFEKVFSNILFKKKSDGSGARKRYAGRVIWEDGKTVDKLYIVGFESRRSDMPQVGRNFLKEVLKMICYGCSREEVEIYVDNFKTKIKTVFTAEEIAIPIGISKPLEQYKNQIHAKASRLANKKYNAQIRQGDKVKYIYVKDKDRVIAFKTDKPMWEGYKINYDKMTKRIVDMKVGPLFDSLGWEHEFNYKMSNKKIKEIAYEDTLIQKGLW